MPHQLCFTQHAVYTHDFPPQEVPHTLIVKMELQVLMASKAQSQHLLWVSQILTHSTPLICSTRPASSRQTPRTAQSFFFSLSVAHTPVFSRVHRGGYVVGVPSFLFTSVLNGPRCFGSSHMCFLCAKSILNSVWLQTEVLNLEGVLRGKDQMDSV